MTSTTTSNTPYYILFSHSPLSGANPGPLSSSLGHPVIEYHYADDSPLSLLPQSADEHVLVLDFDPNLGTLPTAKSISSTLAVTGFKVAESPGSAGDEVQRNDKIYVIETTVIGQEKTLLTTESTQTAHAALSQFKQRNTILRRALLYPDVPAGNHPVTPLPSLPVSPLQQQEH